MNINRIKENIKFYINNFKEGDNIKVTCDLLDTLEMSLKIIEEQEENIKKSNEFIFKIGKELASR